MRRKRNQLIVAVFVAGGLLHLLQIVLIDNFLSIGIFTPDLLLILTVFVGLRLGQIPGAVTGFLAGLLQDTAIQFLGVLALSKTIVGFMAKYFHPERILLAEKFYFPFVVFALSLLHDVVRYSILSLNSSISLATLLWERGILDAGYSAIAGLLLWWMLPDSWIDFVRFNKRYDQ